MIKVNLLEGAADTRAQAKATKAAAKINGETLPWCGGEQTMISLTPATRAGTAVMSSDDG